MCDRCGDLYLLKQLNYQFEWDGPRLQNLGIRVCGRCTDTPQPQLKSIVLPPDPTPVFNPRPQNIFVDNDEGEWLEAMGAVLTSDQSGWGGFTVRQVVRNFLLSNFGTKVRLTLEGPAAGATEFLGVYFQLQTFDGEAYAFAADPLPVLVGGSAAFTVSAGDTVLSDEITMNFDPMQNYVLSAYIGADPNSVLRYKAQDGTDLYYKAGDDAATVTPEGYTAAGTGNRLYCVNSIEAFQI